MPRQSLKKRPDGRYRLMYKGVAFYGQTQDEVYQKREEYKKQQILGLKKEAAGKTVLEYAAEWMKVYKSDVTDNVRDSYASYMKDLTDDCGDMLLQDVTTTDIRKVYNKRSGHSASDIKKQSMIIKGLFESAFDDGLILRNPCKKAKRPEGTNGTHRAIEPWERDIVDKMGETDHRFAAAAVVMLYSGLRRGEALALNIDRDVDIDNLTITVSEAIRFDGNRPELVDPKTEAGKRTIPIQPHLGAFLSGRHGLLVSAPDGGYLSETGFSRLWESYLLHCERMLNGGRSKRWYGNTKEDKELLKEIEHLPKWKEFNIRTHDFRHSYCTMLYEAGVDLKSAQKWMGHADEKMVMQIYAHLSEKQEEKATKSWREYEG